jgi:predicted nucleic acid-binding protein
MLDRSQKGHRNFVDFFDSWKGQVFSSEAVLTEATHLLGRVHGGRKVCLDFFLAGGAVLVPQSLTSVRRCRELLEQYENVPMDFADATLVVLAEDLGTDLVLTTDRKDFGIYRIGGKRPFRIKP